MTAIIGIKCKAGVVIGADSSATFAALPNLKTIEQPTEKLYITQYGIIIAGSGQVGLGQRFCHLAERYNPDQQPDEFELVKVLVSQTIKDWAFTSAPKQSYSAVVAFAYKNNPYLCEFSLNDFQPEFKRDNEIWYCSIGSGEMIIDPFLGLMRNIFWRDSHPPTVNEGIFVAIWALDHAVEVNPGGVNLPIRLTILENIDGKYKSRFISDDELAEHRQAIEEVKQRMRDYRRDLQSMNSTKIPDIPKL
ncbi:MAG: hypothetical protein NTW14_07080 [bacterium]|nr:hypothetical protein [bacterium]